MKRFLLILCFGVIFLNLNAQTPDLNNAVLFDLTIVDGQKARFEWVFEDNAVEYQLSRRINGQGIFSLVSKINSETSYIIDSTLTVGVPYEYELKKLLSNGQTTTSYSGYLFGGIEIPPIHHRGTYLFLAEKEVALSLSASIQRMIHDLEMDGWIVLYDTVNRTDLVVDVKQKIKSFYEKSEGRLSTVLLFGNVPVPYSGNINPDGHPEHKGAWAADVFYADLNGNWTDNTINNASANILEMCRNIPGDGRYDQSIIPSNVELQIGRVDLSKLTIFSLTETQLLSNYLDKNHAFRNGYVQMKKRGLVQNNFPNFNEAFGVNGLSNFTRFFGKANVSYGAYRDALNSDSYLWSYGAGPGSFQSAGGIISTTQLATDSLQTVFSMVFGSYFGNWDNPNNVLRAVLASGSTLTNAWAGRPRWYFHHMAMGRHIGFSTEVTQNNNFYPSGSGGRGVHIALMGDPGLSMYPYSSIDSLTLVTENNTTTLRIHSKEEDEYYVYYKKYVGEETELDSFQLLSPNPSNSKNIDLSCLPVGSFKLMVRAVRLEVNGSGSFYNLSIGKSIDFENSKNPEALVEILFDQNHEILNAVASVENGTIIGWNIKGSPEINIDEQEIRELILPNNSYYELCATATNSCGQFVYCTALDSIQSSLPDSILCQTTMPACFGNSDGSLNLELVGGYGPFSFEWANLTDTTNTLINLEAGIYDAYITTASGITTLFSCLLDEPDELMLECMIFYPSASSLNLVQITVNGGTPPYTSLWSDGIEGLVRENVPKGLYTVTITDSNGCNISKNVEIIASSVKDDRKKEKFASWQYIDRETIKVILDSGSEFDIAFSVWTITGIPLVVKTELSDNQGMIIKRGDLPSGTYVIRLSHDNRIQSMVVFWP